LVSNLGIWVGAEGGTAKQSQFTIKIPIKHKTKYFFMFNSYSLITVPFDDVIVHVPV